MNPPRSLSFPRWFLFFVMFVTACVTASCSDGGVEEPPEEEPKEEEPLVRRFVGMAGDRIHIPDVQGSSLELRIPPGALPREEEIVIRRVPAADYPSEAGQGLVVGDVVLELLPDGLTFDEPIVLTTRIPAAAAELGGDEKMIVPSHVSRSSAGTLDRPATVTTRSRTGSATISARLTHFSKHWTSRETVAGGLALRIDWPETSFTAGMSSVPNDLAITTSGEGSTSFTISYGVFVESASTNVIMPESFPAMDESGVLADELRAVLTQQLEEMEDPRELAVTSAAGGFTAEIAANGALPFEENQLPGLYCTGMGEGTAWLVARFSFGDVAEDLVLARELAIRCVPAATIDEMWPIDGRVGVGTASRVTFRFSEPMEASTLTISAEDGACEGSVQLRVGPDYDTCLGGTIEVISEDDATEFAVTSALEDETRYRLFIDSTVRTAAGYRFPGYTANNGFMTTRFPEDAKVMFSRSVTGNLGGVAGADELCTTLASKPAGVGTAKAMLTSTERYACTVANCGDGSEQLDWVFAPHTHYVRSDGVYMFTTNENGIFVDWPMNSLMGTGLNFWDGLNTDWTSRGTNCDGWTTNDAGVSGGVGFDSGAMDSQWLMGGSLTCNSVRPVFCIEQ